jgi:hypothetical protein
VRPTTVLIDGGIALYFSVTAHTNCRNSSAVVQTTDQGFEFNGESSLDLQYSMALTIPQNITLLQTGDLVEGD